MTDKQLMLAGLNLEQAVGIEIGALANPLVTRNDGRIIYVDHANTDALRAKYATHADVDIAKIVDVDAVWGERSLQEAIGNDVKVDYVLAAHVIEHVPDLLGWLAEIATVLRPGGELRLAVPDRRYSFDYLRQESRFSDLLHARLVKARAPLPIQILDHVVEVVKIDAAQAWQGEVVVDQLPRLHRIPMAMRVAQDAKDNGNYHDVHCWVFTPRSFCELFGRAARAGLHCFKCSQFHDTEPGQLEFYVSLILSADPNIAATSWETIAEELLSPREQDMVLLKQFLVAAQKEHAVLQFRLAEARQHLDEIEQSHSWRVTAPFRALSRMLRGV